MNKGIIMEIKRNYAIALNDEGVMDKVLFKDNMKVGQKIFYFEDDIISNPTSKIHGHNSFIKSFGSIAALFLIVFTFFQIMKPQEAYAVVSLDINPSIQIEADSKFNIIKVEGVNNDGKNIDFTDIKNIPLESGIQKIKDKLVEKNYLDTNKDILVGYAFVQNGDNSNYEKDLKGAIDSTFKSEKVVYVKGDKQDIDDAKTKGISLGRYEAAASDLVDQEIKNKIETAPVKEITASIRDKETPKQWDAQDEKQNNVPAAVEKPEVKIEKPATAEKPVINVAPDTTQSSVESNKGKEAGGKTDKTDAILDLKPDVPAQNGNSGSSSTTTPNNGGSTSTPAKDNTVNVTPNSGTSENTTTTGKTKEDTTKVVTQEPSKLTDNTGDKSVKN